MKREAISHPKVKRLAALLDVRQFGAVGILEMLWKFTAQHAPRGDVGRWTDEEIADAVAWPIEDAGRLVDSLIASRLVDEHASDRLVIHDWTSHTEDSTHMVLARRAERFADGTMPSLTRFSAAERAKIVAAFGEKEKAVETHGTRAETHGTRTPHARHAHKNALPDQTSTRPEPDQALTKPVREQPPELSQRSATPQGTDLVAGLSSDGEDAARLAKRLRQRAGYTGDDGQIFNQVGELIAAGEVSEVIAMEAAAAAAGKDTPPGYFRTALGNAIGDMTRLRLLLLNTGRKDSQP